MRAPACALALLSMLAASTASADDGETIFKRSCSICHAVEAGTNKLGPSLAGIVGKPSASVPDFMYSEAMQKLGITWDDAHLDAYLENPQKMVPGTKMIFLGLKNADDRKAVIEYLKQQH
jgi:cytochrome c